MAPRRRILVDPEAYYTAARKCHELAHDVEAVAQSLRRGLSGLGGMAGHYDAVIQWAKDYDKFTGELTAAADSFASALFTFGDVLNASGFNHALANWLANHSPDKGPIPAEAVPVATPMQTVLPVIQSSGSNGPGLETNVPGLFEQVGMKLPDGHTDKLSAAVAAWNSYAADSRVTGAAGRVAEVSAMFDHLQSDEITDIKTHLETLRTAATQLAENSTAIAQPVGSHQAALGEARRDVDVELGDLKRELALTVTVTVVVIGITMLATVGTAAAGPAEAEGAAGATAVGAAISRAALAIRSAISNSRLFVLLGATAAYAAFKAVPHDLPVIVAKLVVIAKMQVFVDDGGGGSPGSDAEDFRHGEYTQDEIEEFINGHTGDGDPTMNRPTRSQVHEALENATPEPVDDGSNRPASEAEQFVYNGIKVIVNYKMPWRSTAWRLL